MEMGVDSANVIVESASSLRKVVTPDVGVLATVRHVVLSDNSLYLSLSLSIYSLLVCDLLCNIHTASQAHTHTHYDSFYLSSYVYVCVSEIDDRLGLGWLAGSGRLLGNEARDLEDLPQPPDTKHQRGINIQPWIYKKMSSYNSIYLYT